MELVVVQGDALEFEFAIFEEKTGEEYVLRDGERLFFMAKPSCQSGDCVIHEVQTNKYFHIKKVDLMPGVYEFDAGIMFADGSTKTVIDAEIGKLKVKRKTGNR